MTDDNGGPIPVPHIPAPAQTLVMETISKRQLLWIDGLVMLPVGARIELAEPRADGLVTSVRLWGAGPEGSPVLVLDVSLCEAGGFGDLP